MIRGCSLHVNPAIRISARGEIHIQGCRLRLFLNPKTMGFQKGGILSCVPHPPKCTSILRNDNSRQCPISWYISYPIYRDPNCRVL